MQSNTPSEFVETSERGASCSVSRLAASILSVPTLAVALLFGGGQKAGASSDAVVQVFSLPLLVAVIACALTTRMSRQQIISIVLCCLILALPLMQIIPLPQAALNYLPERERLFSIFDILKQGYPQSTLSLSANATFRVFCALIPTISIFLSCLFISQRDVIRLVWIIVTYSIFSVAIFAWQVLDPTTPLRVYGEGVRVGSEIEATALFSGRNSLSALFYISLPLAMALVGGEIVSNKAINLTRTAIGLILCSVLVFGVVAARSRMGFLLGTVGALIMFVVVTRAALGTKRGRAPRPALALLILFGVLFVVILDTSFSRIGWRFAHNIFNDMRWSIAWTSIEAARQFWPLGSGFGTFVPIFMVFETESTLGSAYVNHAHNDILEIAVEGGGLALLLAIVVLILFGLSIYRTFRIPVPISWRLLVRAASLSVVLVVMHTLIEYPLRLHALAAITSVMVAIVVRTSDDYVK